MRARKHEWLYSIAFERVSSWQSRHTATLVRMKIVIGDSADTSIVDIGFDKGIAQCVKEQGAAVAQQVMIASGSHCCT